MKKLLISEVKGLEIIDSRGNPTVQAVVTLEGGIQGVGCAPSGASTGMFEAHELRDADPDRFGGKGVSKAVTSINTRIANVLQGKDAMHLWAIDEMMIREDGTDNKSSLGANAILAVSIAVARAASAALGIPLYRYLGGVQGRELPIPMMNILNGGAHAANNLDIQEFMIMPVGAPSVVEGIRWSTEVYHKLASLLKAKGLATAVGDEGGFAPNVSGEKEALDYIMEAIKLAGYEAGRDFVLAIDAAASEWKTQEEGKYKMPKSKREYTSEELVKFWKELSDEYPIYSLEDGLDEEDWDGWKILTSVLGDRLQLVGDDLFVTNIKRLEKGIAEGCGNAILIKPNQIGSLSETMEAIRMAQKNGFRTIISHRSGETEDTTIADLAVAVNAGQIKTGAPCRTERVAKYNRLLAIASEL